jgi:asparagine synthase (glutamine-hydrolysing)
MCGIAGIIAPEGIKERRALQAMSGALEHRGPDGYGYLLYSNADGLRIWHNQEMYNGDEEGNIVGFAHRRLSIIDLSPHGLQPMTDETESLSIVYNGEIYNYLELRAELEKLGHTFRTESDTEVLLHAFHAWGTECFKRLNGMWALVILDVPNQRLIFARDRFGIKPLYYTIRNRVLYFASEIKALLTSNSIPCVPNENTVAHFLITGLSDVSQNTFFKRILSFPAANWAEISIREESLEVRPQSYWSFPKSNFEGTEQDAVQQFRALLLDSIRVHARSDVPVGTCLSGGIDSSAIVCSSEVLRQEHRIPSYSHNAFGYCAADEELLEKPFMDAAIKATGVQMHYVEIEPQDFSASVPRIIKAQDEPFASASIMVQWFVFQRARQEGMTVMLDGQGADEILGGYHYYFNTLAGRMLRRIEIARFLSLRRTYEREIGPFPISTKAVVARLIPKPFQQVAIAARNLLISQGIYNPMPTIVAPVLLRDYRDAVTSRNFIPISLDQALKRDIQSYSLPALLRYEDRNSMAHSIEARVPFLDHRLVDFAFTLPDEWKINEVTTKYILRQGMKGTLPESIRNRKDKIGFRAAPSLLFDFVGTNITALAENKTKYEQRWFDPRALDRVLHNSNGSLEAQFLLWRVVNTKLWARQFWS